MKRRQVIQPVIQTTERATELRSPFDLYTSSAALRGHRYGVVSRVISPSMGRVTSASANSLPVPPYWIGTSTHVPWISGLDVLIADVSLRNRNATLSPLLLKR